MPMRLRKSLSTLPLRPRISNNTMTDHKRIYLYHVRKAGGRSLIAAFLTLGDGDVAELYRSLCRNKRIIVDNKIIVGWKKRWIEKGNYYFAFSHQTMHEIVLPPDTFTITCLRNPIDRLLSHYRMLLEFRMKRIKHPCMKIEGKWLGTCFKDFLLNIPREHLLRQLYMFSHTFDCDEAFANIMDCSFFFLLENFDEAVMELSSKLKIPIRPLHFGKTELVYLPTGSEIDTATEMLQPEITLYEKLKHVRYAKNIP